MTTTAGLRTAVIGLVAFAAAEEQMLLAASSSRAAGDVGVAGYAGVAGDAGAAGYAGVAGDVGAAGDASAAGDAACWAALPLVAHNAEFRRQQVERLAAIRDGRTPDEYSEIDHTSALGCERYQAVPAARVAAEASASASDLISYLSLTSDADLCEPARNPWLKGRQLWLQIIVRGFWHPAGHLADYYLAHDQPARAVALAAHAVATARYLDAPAPARGMACYNLACAQSRTGDLDLAAATVDAAIGLNPDLRRNASRDPDLRALRDSGRFKVASASRN